SDFGRAAWTQQCDAPILEPVLDWEKNCIEAATICRRGDRLFMFYAGAYNNEPQQVGVAVSEDGLRWKRLSDEPFLTNGAPGTWNSSESGHPCIFVDPDGAAHLAPQTAVAGMVGPLRLAHPTPPGGSLPARRVGKTKCAHHRPPWPERWARCAWPTLRRYGARVIP
ncbi:hypothetical protein, partial [Thioalkalivibrio sp.]|uniref:hypothetical protein n=1 Tax=Thioalkalivibrio sp. TaxID=2093813 RepID=UPI0039761395